MSIDEAIEPCQAMLTDHDAAFQTGGLLQRQVILEILHLQYVWSLIVSDRMFLAGQLFQVAF
jgi:hypothetical protein